MKKILSVIILIFLLPVCANALPVYKEVRNSYLKSDSLLLDRWGVPLHELRTDKDRRPLFWIRTSSRKEAGKHGNRNCSRFLLPKKSKSNGQKQKSWKFISIWLLFVANCKAWPLLPAVFLTRSRTVLISPRRSLWPP